MKGRVYSQTRRAEQTRARRAQMLDAARHLIEAHGFHGLSLEALATAAGLTRRTVYNQLGSKLGLLEAVLDRVADRGRAADLAGVVAEGGPIEGLDRLLEGTCRLWSMDRL